MEKFKYTINVGEDKKLAKEVLYLLESIGFKGLRYKPRKSAPWVYVNDLGDIMVCSFKATEDEEVTISELRDMVVLKHNDESDASHVNENTGEFYRVISGVWHVLNEKWEPSSRNGLWILRKTKPIKEGVMKEYLVKTDSGNYLYTKNVSDIAAERVIEIPQGANVYVRCNIFGDYKWLPKIIDGDWSVLWQREKETLSDKVATAEVARQDVLKPEDFGAVDNVNHPSHYASGGIECIDAMIAAYGVEAVKAYCKCNAFKYQWRFDKKNGNEDILKAQWYQNKYMELSNEI